VRIKKKLINLCNVNIDRGTSSGIRGT